MIAHLSQQSVPQHLTILVVEDNYILRSTASEYFCGAGCRVLEADSGEDAISLFSEHPEIDVVFTDIQLAGPLNGWDVGEACRGARPAIAVIYASGACGEDRRPVAGSRFFNKPYLPEVVLDACRGLCNGVH